MEYQDGEEWFCLFCFVDSSLLSLSSSVWSPSSTLQMATVDEKQATLWKLEQSTAMVTILCVLGRGSVYLDLT